MVVSEFAFMLGIKRSLAIREPAWRGPCHPIRSVSLMFAQPTQLLGVVVGLSAVALTAYFYSR